MDTNLFLLLTDDYAVCHFCPQWCLKENSLTRKTIKSICVYCLIVDRPVVISKGKEGEWGNLGGRVEFVGKSLGDSFFKGKTTILFGVVLRIFVSFSRYFFRVYVFVFIFEIHNIRMKPR